MSKPMKKINLRREIFVVLIVKVILLFVIWNHFFSQNRHFVTPLIMTEKILGTQKGEKL